MWIVLVRRIIFFNLFVFNHPMSARKSSIRLLSRHRLPVFPTNNRMVIYCLLISRIFTGLMQRREKSIATQHCSPLSKTKTRHCMRIRGYSPPWSMDSRLASRFLQLAKLNSKSQLAFAFLSPLENHWRNFSLLSVSISANKKHCTGCFSSRSACLKGQRKQC